MKKLLTSLSLLGLVGSTPIAFATTIPSATFSIHVQNNTDYPVSFNTSKVDSHSTTNSIPSGKKVKFSKTAHYASKSPSPGYIVLTTANGSCTIKLKIKAVAGIHLYLISSIDKNTKNSPYICEMDDNTHFVIEKTQS